MTRMDLLHGVPVTVELASDGAKDRHGNATAAYQEARVVENVLPAPSTTEDLCEGRQDGVSVDMTFHFPKSFAESLRGARVTSAGTTYDVVGDPQPYLADLTPGDWDRAVSCVIVRG